MKIAKAHAAVVLGCFAVLCAGPAAAQTDEQKQKAAEQKQPEMSPEQKAQMEAWTKAMTPGAEHKRLSEAVGTWNATVTMWESPGAAPQVSQGVTKRRMALGGRVLIDEWSGTMMGMPFEGLGTTGYDNVSKKWWGTWTDNTTTGVMTTRGTCDADPKKGCTYVGTMVNMMTGKDENNRQTVSWTSPDEERFTMYAKGPDGKEFRVMEIVSKRAK